MAYRNDYGNDFDRQRGGGFSGGYGDRDFGYDRGRNDFGGYGRQNYGGGYDRNYLGGSYDQQTFVGPEPNVNRQGDFGHRGEYAGNWGQHAGGWNRGNDWRNDQMHRGRGDQWNAGWYENNTLRNNDDWRGGSRNDSWSGGRAGGQDRDFARERLRGMGSGYGTYGAGYGAGYGSGSGAGFGGTGDSFGGTYGNSYGGAFGGGYGAGMRGTSADRGRSFAGRGPKGYQRSDDRIHEDVSEMLTHDGDLDASDIEVKVENGEVTLTGNVDSRSSKRRAEDIAFSASGVRDVHNRLKIEKGLLDKLFGSSEDEEADTTASDTRRTTRARNG